MKNSNSPSFRHNPEDASQKIITTLMDKFKEHISQKIVQKAMPINQKQMNQQIFQSMTKLDNLQCQQSTGISSILQNNALKRDNLSTNKISIIQPVKAYSTSNTPRNRGRNRSIFSNRFRQQSTIGQKKLSNIKEQENKKFTALPSKQSIGAISFSTDLLRIRMINIEQLNRKSEENKKIEDQKKDEYRRKMERKIKQYQKFTNDYEGNFFGVHPFEQNYRVRTLKSDIEPVNQRSQKQIAKILKSKKPTVTHLKNNRLIARNQRLKTESALSSAIEQSSFTGEHVDIAKQMSDNWKLQANVNMISQNIPLPPKKQQIQNQNNLTIRNKSLKEFKQKSLKFYKFNQKQLFKGNPQNYNRKCESQAKLPIYDNKVTKTILSSKYKSKPTLQASNNFESSISSPSHKKYPIFADKFFNSLARKTEKSLQKSQKFCKSAKKPKSGKINVNNQTLFEKTIDFY